MENISKYITDYQNKTKEINEKITSYADKYQELMDQVDEIELGQEEKKTKGCIKKIIYLLSYRMY